MATASKGKRKLTVRQVALRKQHKNQYTLPVKKGYHRHHIVPFHAGGKVHPWNEEYVRPHEHANKHLLRWVETGDVWDYLAYAALMGWSFNTGRLLQAAGSKGGTRTKGMVLNKEIQTSFQRDTELASRAGKLGGKIGGPAALKKLLLKNPNNQRDAGIKGAKTQIYMQQMCSCGFICRPCNMWRHQKAHNHEGSTRSESKTPI